MDRMAFVTAPRTILTVFGTRPEAIKLFPLLHALEADPRFASRVCVSGQHRGMLDQVLEIAGIVPHHDLDVMQPDQSLDALTARLLTGLGAVMDAEKPNVVVVQGDTATAMCGALAAYYRKIPVAHVEAGLRSGNIHHPWPEEVNRKVIGSFAEYHFAPTETAAAALRRENIDPAAIEVEITENTAMGNPAVTQAILEKLRRIGVQVAIDDFGTGYSSLATLKLFPVTRLKIDRAFVHNIVDDPGDAAIVLAIIRMAHSLKLSVVAEGVENESQLAFLQSHDCDEAQGYLFAHPLSPEDLVMWLKSRATAVQPPISTTRH